MDNTIITQGRFTSDGTPKMLSIRSDVDWMEVINFTEGTTVTGSRGVKYEWQRGLAANNGFVYVRNAGGTAVDFRTSVSLAVPGFTLLDSSSQVPGAPIALTAITAANPPVVTIAANANLLTNDVVRLERLDNQPQAAAIDYTIEKLSATTFSLRYMFLAGSVASTAGFYRIIPFQPMFYPRNRTISAITQAASAVVTMTVTHGYTVGQEVRLTVPAAFGMTEMDGLSGTITAVTSGATNTITLNIDSSGFSAFVFPAAGDLPFTLAQVVPFGEDTAQALLSGTDILGDATRNTAFLGMRLGTGITSPAGSNGDVIYWKAGKSFSVENAGENIVT